MAGEIVSGLRVLDAVQNGTVEMGHSAGTKLPASPQAVTEAAFAIANQLHAELSAKSPKSKSIYESWRRFRNEEILWSRICEGGFDNFIVRMSAAGKLSSSHYLRPLAGPGRATPNEEGPTLRRGLFFVPAWRQFLAGGMMMGGGSSSEGAWISIFTLAGSMPCGLSRVMVTIFGKKITRPTITSCSSTQGIEPQ